MDRKVKQLTAIGMLCALAYAAAVIGRVPLVLFLKYDPKDIIIAISGLMFGPAASLGVALFHLSKCLRSAKPVFGGS